MADGDAALVLELIRAANEAEQLTNSARASLLQRAADTLRDYRYQINYSGTPANDDGSNDPAREWSEMARTADQFTAGEVSQKLLDAADLIKVARMMLEEKQAIERGET